MNLACYCLLLVYLVKILQLQHYPIGRKKITYPMEMVIDVTDANTITYVPFIYLLAVKASSKDGTE